MLHFYYSLVRKLHFTWLNSWFLATYKSQLSSLNNIWHISRPFLKYFLKKIENSHKLLVFLFLFLSKIERNLQWDFMINLGHHESISKEMLKTNKMYQTQKNKDIKNEGTCKIYCGSFNWHVNWQITAMAIISICFLYQPFLFDNRLNQIVSYYRG